MNKFLLSVYLCMSTMIFSSEASKEKDKDSFVVMLKKELALVRQENKLVVQSQLRLKQDRKQLLCPNNWRSTALLELDFCLLRSLLNDNTNGLREPTSKDLRKNADELEEFEIYLRDMEKIGKTEEEKILEESILAEEEARQKIMELEICIQGLCRALRFC
jgi:hypothetical protein